MLNCKDVTEQSSDYLEQQLPLRKRLQMRIHLLMCDHCRRYLRQMTTTIGIIRSTSSTISDDAAQQIVEKIIDQKDVKS